MRDVMCDISADAFTKIIINGCNAMSSAEIDLRHSNIFWWKASGLEEVWACLVVKIL